MDPFSSARVASAGKTLYGLSKEPQLHQILTALAADEGRAAARAIMDAEHSDHPEDELQQAIALLRLCYENYATRAQNHVPSLVELLGTALHRKQALRARFRAAFIAISVASLYQMIDNEQQRECWQQLASDDFYATYHSEAIVWQATISRYHGRYAGYSIIRLEEEQAAALNALRCTFERHRDSIPSLRPVPESNPRLELAARMVGTPMKLPMSPWDLLKRDYSETTVII